MNTRQQTLRVLMHSAASDAEFGVDMTLSIVFSAVIRYAMVHLGISSTQALLRRHAVDLAPVSLIEVEVADVTVEVPPMDYRVSERANALYEATTVLLMLDCLENNKEHGDAVERSLNTAIEYALTRASRESVAAALSGYAETTPHVAKYNAAALHPMGHA